MRPKTTGVLVVMVFLLGIITIIQSNLAYASTSEKIPLVQKFEQFPGQKITGFCYLQIDNKGNLDWRIKVNGLEPETQGHFDLGHWAGEVDVPFTANEEGKADSKNQTILANDVPFSLFSQFAKCQVHTSGYSHFTSPVIALGVPGDGGADTEENKNQNIAEEKFSENNPQGLALGVSKSLNTDVGELKKENPTEKKFFLFAALDFLFGIFSFNEDESVVTNSDFVISPPPSNNRSPSNDASNSVESDDDTEKKSPNKNSIKNNQNFQEINPNVITIKEEQGKADKSSANKGNDKADKSSANKGNDKADKSSADKGNDKADKSSADKGNDKADKSSADKGKR